MQEAKVAADAGVAGSLDGRIAEDLPKLLFCQLFPVHAPEIEDGRDGGKSRLGRGLRKTIPGAYVLAGIATKEPVVESSFHGFGYQQFFELDRIVRNALAAVDHFILLDRIGRARVYATAAGAAIVARKGDVVLQFEIYYEGGDKEKGSRLSVEQIAALPDPAQTASHGPASFEYGRAVDEPTTVYLPYFLPYPAQQFLQFASDDFVIIRAKRILGDAGRGWLLLEGREVVDQQSDDRPGAGDQPGRVYPQVEMVFHIVHRTLHPLPEPIFKPAGIIVQANGLRDAAMIEAQFPGPLLNKVCVIVFCQLSVFCHPGV